MSASPVSTSEIGGVVAITRVGGIGAIGCAGVRPEEALGDGRPDERAGQRRQEERAEAGRAAAAEGPLHRAGLPDLGPSRGPGERGRIVAPDLAGRHLLGQPVEDLAALIRCQP